MVIVLGNNEYTLSDVDEHSKLLTLGRKYFLWEQKENDTGTLTRIKKPVKVVRKKEKGNYWLFNVTSHPGFTPGVHLSLVSDGCCWQAFLIDGHYPPKLGESSPITVTTERIARPPKSLLPAQSSH